MIDLMRDPVMVGGVIFITIFLVIFFLAKR